ncbi:MAG: hypothetical protein QG628_514 [Patescibacteria group bacterium]|jgi:hypothetical protein|nr:hypothetical protein [Patescibacteria group bacterium]
MKEQLNIDKFVNQIMNITVTRMGGASAGIFGQAGADADITNTLKRVTIAFATEYQKSTPDKNIVLQYAKDIEGQLQTLVLTNTLSEKEANELIDQLHSLIQQ